MTVVIDSVVLIVELLLVDGKVTVTIDVDYVVLVVELLVVVGIVTVVVVSVVLVVRIISSCLNSNSDNRC